MERQNKISGKRIKTFFSDKSRAGKIIRTELAVCFWILVWFAAASLANRNLMLKIPQPWETVATLFRDFGDPVFWKAAGTSVMHILLGYLAAVALGFIGGMMSGINGWFRSFSAPLMYVIRAVPVAAFVIIAWLWIPNDILPACISGLMVLPIIWGHVDSGLLSIDPHYTDMAQTDGAGKWRSGFFIYLPMIHNQVRIGCLNGFGIAWKAGVAAEVICNPTGSLGALLQKAKTGIDFPQVFAVTLAVVGISVLIEFVMKTIWRPLDL